MGSWRDQASDVAQSDLDLLVSVALEMAEVALDASGELRPFFVGIKQNGDTTKGSLGEDLDAVEIVDRLQRVLRRNRNDYRALALVKDVTLAGEDSEAIWVDLCHSEGPAMTCYLPYEARDGSIVNGMMGAQGLANLFW